jgi:hypothetical protein
MARENIDWKGAGEALFYSLYYAATSGADAIQKEGFFRPDAALSVIFMSDDAEEGFPYPSKQVWGLPPKCNWGHHETMRKTFYDPRGINTDTTFAALRRLKGDMPLVTNAFVNITKQDIMVDNDMNAHCIYDSPGFGYFDIVKRTNGLLYSIHQDRGRGLEISGRLLKSRLELMHDFKLSKPANLVDPSTIEADVDGKRESHAYSADTNFVHIEQAGHAGSLIDITHCQPIPQHDWSITGFGGTAGQTTASLHWSTTEHPTSGKILFGTSQDSLNDVALDSSTSTQHGVEIAGLSPNTLYYFQAVSGDEFGTEKRSEIISLRTRPDWQMGQLVGQASLNSVSLQWSTDSYPTVGKVIWGSSPDQLGNGSSETAPIRDHVVGIDGLQANTLYYFQAISRDEFGLEKRSSVLSLRTLSDWAIVGFTGQASRTTASLVWQTPETATQGLLRYGLSADSLDKSVADDAVGTVHGVSLSGLTPATTYYFQAISRDGATERRSSVISLRTLNDWVIADISSSPTETTVSASFSTSGYPTDGKFLWGTSAGNLAFSVDAGTDSESHEASITGLSPDTVYYLRAVASDNLGVTKRSDVFTVRTKAQIDPLPKWSITNFEGSGGLNSVLLTWQTSEYPTKATVQWGTSPESLKNSEEESTAGKDHVFTVTGLTPDTFYYFRVVARDDRGQEQSSSIIAVRTQAVPLPSWEIAGFAGTGSVHSVALSWSTADYPTTGKVRWGLSSTNLTQVALGAPGPVNSHALTVNGLDADTTYFFQAVSTDDRGQTKSSEIISVKTQTVPPAWSIVGFDGTTTATEASLIWQTPNRNTKATLKVGLSADDLTWRTVSIPSFASTHQVTVPGLTPNTLYFFQVVATDEDGGVVKSNVIFKKTKTRGR